MPNSGLHCCRTCLAHSELRPPIATSSWIMGLIQSAIAGPAPEDADRAHLSFRKAVLESPNLGWCPNCCIPVEKTGGCPQMVQIFFFCFVVVFFSCCPHHQLARPVHSVNIATVGNARPICEPRAALATIKFHPINK